MYFNLSVLEHSVERSISAEVNSDESPKPSLVDVYSDRLCAITHAFALCCSTVRKSIGGCVCVCVCVTQKLIVNRILCSSGLLTRFSGFIDKYESVLKLLLAR